jgi:hypothetical protein
LLVSLFTAVAACAPGAEPASAPPPSSPWFVDRAEQSGLRFTHMNGMSGQLYDVEVFPPGVALFDFDNDGDLDVYLVQGRPLDPATVRSAPSLDAQGRPLGDRLFRNDMVSSPDGSRVLRFTDVTSQSGISPGGYGMGVATGDIDNDGWTDLYLTRLGTNHLYRNNGDGTFADVSARSGVGGSGWSVSASFVDIDRDGWLDLYVGNYLRYRVDADVRCQGLAGQPDYCPPRSYQPQADRLYRNRGDGTFVDVSTTALQGHEARPALGVTALDANRDGWLDIYVANDSQADTLWLNQRDGTFCDGALVAGAAFNRDGQVTASMGVAAGDVDNDGDEDIVHANLTGEGHTLLVNDGTGVFDDLARARGLTAPTLPFTGFGAGWIDVDNDGWLDLLTVNGAVRTIDGLAGAGDPFPLRQRKQLLRNRGGGVFVDVTEAAGPALTRQTVGRGLAFGDVDNDGDVDVLVGNNNGAAELLVNERDHAPGWVGLRLLGAGAAGSRGRDMLGALVEIRRSHGGSLWRRVKTDGSYASASDPRVLAGLGGMPGSVGVRVVWPNGRAEEWHDVASRQWVTLRQGTGREEP